MAKADYRGARGGLAGTDFHALWALSQALRLLNPRDTVVSVSVEGIGSASGNEGDASDYDGVDCTLLHGDSTFATASTIELVQLKYSGSKPRQSWTLTRLKTSDKKNGNNSVLRRLADAYKRVSVEASVRPTIRLVSNQPVSDAVLKGVEALASAKPAGKAFKDDFKTATGLPVKTLKDFASSLDLVSHTGSRFELEDQLLQQISAWTDDDARAVRDNLLTYVQKLMMPESAGRTIRRENIISIISGLNSEESLFPCPTDITYPTDAILRRTSSDLADRLLNGAARVCLHGGAGFGKTTILQQIDALLPQGSATVLFDCYGAGRYLDASRKRHSPDDAFRQISNDMAIRLGLPLFLTRENGGTARTFAKRISVAAETLGKLNPSAILLVAIDAADNSLMAANHFRERSFVEDLVSIQEFPSNVRLVLSCRSSRKADLHLPTSFVDCPLTGFTRAETGAYVRASIPEASDAWVEDFHVLSGGVPRVQQYALKNGGKSPDGPLGLLRPSGKTLNVIFESIFEEALRKSGIATSFSRFCAALIALPRPIPLAYCAKLCGIDREVVRDLCQDLAPGLRMEGDSIAFADEDIEAFVLDRAADQLAIVSTEAAQLLFNEHDVTDYAAIHVATALYHAGQKSELLNIIEQQSEPKTIVDPLRRREVQLQRVQLGVYLANDMDDGATALRALLRGAEAIKADDAILDLYKNNLDLAANFAEDSVRRKILLSKDDVERHGELIAALMLKSAVGGQSTLTRLYRRQYDTWLYQRDLEAETEEFGNFSRERKWEIKTTDVASVVEAAFLIEGSDAGLAALMRWRPRRLALDVADVFVPRLLIRGRSDLVQPLFENERLPALFRAYVATAWIRAGLAAPTKTLVEILGARQVRSFVKARRLGYGEASRAQYAFLDKFLFLCEKVVSDAGDDPAIRALLQNLCKTELRADDRLSDSDTEFLSVLGRAYCLLCALDERVPTVNDFLGRGAEWKAPQRDSSERRRVENLETVSGMLISFFSERSKLLIAKQSEKRDTEALMNKAVSHVRGYGYRIDLLYKFNLLRLLSFNMLDLIYMTDVSPSVVFMVATSVLGEDKMATGFQLVPIYARASADGRLHESILKWVTERDEFVRAMEATSREKIESFTALARSIITFAPDDAKILFTHAHEATVEIDSDARFQLRSLSTLCALAIPSLDSKERKQVAARFTLLTSHAAIRLQNEDGFPWAQIGRALTVLHPAIALAASARWQDSSLASLSDTLPAILENLQHPELNTGELRLALNPLLEEATFPHFSMFRSQSMQNDLCRDVLQFGTHSEIRRLSEQVVDVPPTLWTARVLERQPMEAVASPQTQEEEAEDKKVEELLSGLSLTSAIDLKVLLERSHGPSLHLSPYNVLRQAQRKITVGDRIRFLDALVELVESNQRGQDVIDSFEHAKSSWGTPAVQAWFNNEIPKLLARSLSAFSFDIAWGSGNTLDRFLTLVDRSMLIGKDLIEGIGNGLEGFTAGEIYGLISRVYSYFPGTALNQVLIPYSERLIADIPSGLALSEELVSDIPDDINDALARYVTALLSDVDTRLRWRAAHSMRRLIAYAPSEIVPHFTGLWNRTEERSFRAPKAPFYWQAARLWTVLTLSRIATDQPSRFVSQKNFLLGILKDADFPHPAVRSFAQDILHLLQDASLITLTTEEQQTLDKAVDIGLARIEREHGSSWAQSDEQGTHPRWRFDALDTLPYWFRPASGIFANVTTQQLADEAERWIVDRWHIDPQYSKGRNEPRQSRFSERDYVLRSNRHGTIPVMEDYESFLAWYGLQCAIGSLALTEPFSKTTYDDGQDEFEERLERQKLTEPPYWLADMLSPRPIDPALLAEPKDLSIPENANEWFSEVSERDFLKHLFRGGIGGDQLIVAGDIAANCSKFRWKVDIRSALVSSENSLSLVRALQTAPEPFDYCLPYAGEHHSNERCALEEPGFELHGWIIPHETGERIDENDPLNLGTSRTRFSPHPNSGKPTLREDGVLNWPTTNGIAFQYERWKDERDLTDRDYEGPDPKSKGWRLFASGVEIEAYLQSAHRDLIIEVDLTREKGERSYQRREKEDSERVQLTEGRFTGIFLFRADGSIFTADRRLGTWKALSL
jgi:hypothetical protein